MASYSQAQFWLGDGEQARYTKLAVNLMLAVSAGMLGEALALALAAMSPPRMYWTLSRPRAGLGEPRDPQ